MKFEFVEETDNLPPIRIVGIGVGGAGGNAINHMIQSDLKGVEFIAVNTDVQALNTSLTTQKIQIGSKITNGQGTGGDTELGRLAIEEDKNLVADALKNADMVFITCGMGGGTGTGAAPTIASIARELGSLTVAIVTRPFEFEGRPRALQAEEGIKSLQPNVDTLIVIPNQRLLSIVSKETPIDEAFKVADEVLLNAARGISELIVVPGLVNLDFADVKTVMKGMGNALIGFGVAKGGDNRAREAVHQAISSPLLEEINIAGAKKILVNIAGGKELTLHEVYEAVSAIFEAAGQQANIKFGAVPDSKLNGEIHVTVIATGFQSSKQIQWSSANNMNRTVGVFPADEFDKEKHTIEEGIQQLADKYKRMHEELMELFAKVDLRVPTFLRKKDNKTFRDLKKLIYEKYHEP